MPPKPPRRTRERIVETALALFNRRGEPNVTTAHIADEMNISPGNLYYHYRNKEEIVGELYARLETSIAPLLAVPEQRAPGVEDIWLLLHLLFERMWDYRFFYRDLDEIVSRNRRIATRFAALTRGGEATVKLLCSGMRDTGDLQASDHELAALARNVVIVATYWMSFQRVTNPRPARPADADETTADLDFAARQVLALIAPFLHGEPRVLIDRLGSDYL